MKICNSNTEPSQPRHPDVEPGDVVKATYIGTTRVHIPKPIISYYLVMHLPGKGPRMVGLTTGGLFSVSSLFSNSSQYWIFEKVTDKVCLKVEE